MKFAYLLACGCVLASFPLVIRAQTPESRSATPSGAPQARASRQSPALRPQPISLLLRALDSNHDGVIDAEEIAEASEALDALDKDGDGRLTQDEYELLPRSSAAARRRAATSTARPVPAVVPIPRGGLENFGVVDDHLFRGAQPGPEGIRTLKAFGVTTIVDLTLPDKVGEAEKAEAERQGLNYVNIPMDSLAPPAPEQATAILTTISNAPGKVFLHCRQGKDRTGTIVACYRILHCDWTNEQALGEADRFRMVREALQMREFIAEFGRPAGGLGDEAPVP